MARSLHPVAARRAQFVAQALDDRLDHGRAIRFRVDGVGESV
ncbi:hypothetical protein [Micromonospora schwarzwaldensis]